MNPTHHTLAVLTAAILVVSTDRVLAQADSIAPKLPVVWQTLKNHDKAIISPDGKTVAFVRITSGGNTTLHRRDTKTSFLTIPDCAEYLTFFTADSKHLIAPVRRSERDKTPRGLRLGVWDLAEKKQVRTFDLLPHHAGNHDATGGKMLIINTRGLLAAYDYTTGKCLGDFEDKEHCPRYMALSADGKWLLTAGAKAETNKYNQLRVWDVEKRKLFCELHDFGDRDDIGAIAISRDGKWCAVTVGARVWVFDRENRTEMGRITVWMDSDGLLFAPGGETLLILGSGCYHGLNVWDWKKSKDVRGGTPVKPKNLRDREEKVWEKKHNFGTLRDASIADDGTLLTHDPKRLVRLWTFLNTKPKDTDSEVPKKDNGKK